MVVSGRRHSIYDTVAVAAVASGRRRRPADLLQVVVSVEILPAVVAAVVVGRRCFHCRSSQSF